MSKKYAKAGVIQSQKGAVVIRDIDETIVEEAGQGSGDLETPDVISFSRRRLLSHPIQPPAKKLRGNIQI